MIIWLSLSNGMLWAALIFTSLRTRLDVLDLQWNMRARERVSDSHHMRLRNGGL